MYYILECMGRYLTKIILIESLICMTGSNKKTSIIQSKRVEIKIVMQGDQG